MFRTPSPFIILLCSALLLGPSPAFAAPELEARIRALEVEIERVRRSSISPRALDESVSASVERHEAKARAETLARMAEARSKADEAALQAIRKVEGSLEEQRAFSARLLGFQEASAAMAVEVRDLRSVANAGQAVAQELRARVTKLESAPTVASQIDSAMGPVRAAIQATESRIKSVEAAQGELATGKDLEAVQSRVSKIESAPTVASQLDSALGPVRAAIEATESRLKSVEAARGELARGTDLEAIQSRVSKIESAPTVASQLDSALGPVRAAIAATEVQIKGVAAAQGDLASGKDLEAIQSRVSKIESAPTVTSQLDSALGPVRAAIEATESRLKSVEAARGELASVEDVLGVQKRLKALEDAPNAAGAAIVDLTARLVALEMAPDEAAEAVDVGQLVVALDDARTRLTTLESATPREVASNAGPVLEALTPRLDALGSSDDQMAARISDLERQLVEVVQARAGAVAAVGALPEGIEDRLRAGERAVTAMESNSVELQSQLAGVVEQLNANLVEINADLQAVAVSQEQLQGRAAEGYRLLGAQLQELGERLAKVEAILSIQ